MAILPDPTKEQAEEAILFAEFLQSIPPGKYRNISDLQISHNYSNGGHAGFKIATPQLNLHCENQACGGMRFFRCVEGHSLEISPNASYQHYLTYICSNCRVSKKIFSISIMSADLGLGGACRKFGEMPEFGPPTSARLFKLIGSDRDLFLKGRRCENQGLGVGAFVYYRRAVEQQKNKILEEIIKVAKKVNSGEETILLLETAKAESQFSKSLTSVKDAIPQTLLINGHNPLTLLHSALSDGLHERSDEECLEAAHSVRIVLGELSERLSQALKDEVELNSALSRLLAPKKPK